MVLTVTEDTPADMLAGSMELLVQLPRDHHLHTQRVTVLRNTPMMDLLVQIATAHKLTASSYTLQAIGERGLILPHHPNTPIGALDALQVKLLPKQGTCVPRKTKQINQPFETTFRLQVHLPRNQLYVSRVSPKMNLGEILDEVCREKNLDRNKYELRHPTNLEETLDLALSLQDYHLQEVTLYAKQARTLGPTLSTQDIMALQRQEERRRQQTKQNVFGFIFKKSKESSLSTDSLGGRSVSPARSDETGRSASPLQPPARPQRKRRPAPKPPTDAGVTLRDTSGDSGKVMINHSRNSSDSSGYHEASVLSDNPDSAGTRLPETLPRRSKTPGVSDNPRKLAQTSRSSKSLGNLAATGGTLSRGISSTSLSSTGLRKKRAAPPPPAPRPLSSAISTQALERIVDSEESLTSDMDPSKPPSDIGMPSKANSDIDCPKANSDIGVSTKSLYQQDYKQKLETATCESNSNIQQNSALETNAEICARSNSASCKLAKVDSEIVMSVEAVPNVESRVAAKRVGEPAPLPKPRKISANCSALEPPKALKRNVALVPPRTSCTERDSTDDLLYDGMNAEYVSEACCSASIDEDALSLKENDIIAFIGTEEVQLELDSKCPFSNENKLNQQANVSHANNDIAIDNASLSQPLNHENESNSELHLNSVESNYSNTEGTFIGFRKNSQNKKELHQHSKILNSNNDIENSNPPNLNKQLNDENNENPNLRTCFIEDKKSSEKLLSSEREIDFEKKNDNFSIQNDKVNLTDADIYEGEDECNHSHTLLSDNFQNEGVIESNCMTEQSSEQVKTVPPRIPGKIICTCETQENTKATKHVQLKDTTSGTLMKSSLGKDRESCTVISTIPKCERLDAIKEDNLNNVAKRVITTTNQKDDEFSQINCEVEKVDELPEERENNHTEESINSVARNMKRMKVFRSQSNSDDFEIDSLNRQKRYLTSPPEDIVYALNLNLPIPISSSLSEKKCEKISTGHCINPTRNLDVDKGDSYGGLVTADEGTLSETDLLLQKVSDTLSNTLSTPSSSIPSSSPCPGSNYASASVQTNDTDIPDKPVTKLEFKTKDESNDTYKSCTDFSTENILTASTPNVTMGLQQNTSDYVSAMGEDLSISDWEYQLPDPPSAFRDSHSPTIDGYDTITLKSVDAFKELSMNQALDPTDTTDNSCNKNIATAKDVLNNLEVNVKEKASSNEMEFVSEAEIDIKQVSKPAIKQISQKSEASSDLRKKVISELENKIENGVLTQPINKDTERRNMDSVFAPKIAPVDNTLSNFTITTYTKQKSLDIFDEIEEPSSYARHSDERFIKTFATLSRNNITTDYDRNISKSAHLTNGMLHDKKATNKSKELNTDNADCKMEPKTRNQGEVPSRWQSLNAANEKTNIQRSKSYISMSSNAKYQTETQGINERKYERHIEPDMAGIKKATSITSLNVDVLRGNEKFSQWRHNILKRQEEPTKEKQLQSLQVLKSILPQLKNAQQAEENVSKDYNKALLIEQTRYEDGSNEHSVKTNVVSTNESREPNYKQSSKKENTKRYTGPPAISLGSWSERPSANVQIKMDIDYKLGKNSASGNKTVVNINGTRNENDAVSYTRNVTKDNIFRQEINIEPLVNKNSDELTRKFITHTTASGFKKSILNRTHVPDSMKDEDRPVVTGVELKKSFVEMKEMPRNGDNEVDTTPVNFRELTKTFGQHVHFKPKPKRANINRHSVYYHGTGTMQLDEIEKISSVNVKQNGHAKFANVSNHNDLALKSQPLTNGIQQIPRAKKFTSIVGINPINQNMELQSEIHLKNNVNIMKINPPMPIVKGFKISSIDSKTRNGQFDRNGLSTTDTSKKDIQPVKPVTMPVITGVTLKSANVRPKSLPIQIDPRDVLLESIRNFGGREKLKSAAERC